MWFELLVCVCLDLAIDCLHHLLEMSWTNGSDNYELLLKTFTISDILIMFFFFNLAF